MSDTLTTVLENGTTVNITKSDGNVVVEASIPQRVLARDPKVACSTGMIIEVLQEQGVETGNILVGNGQLLSNSKNNKETTGRWIFETPRKARAKSRKNSRTTTRKEQPAEKTKEVSKPGTNKLLGTEDME
jgi:hypothetical protein